jgi:hypothetical protein
MSKIKIQGNASGTGVVTLTAPNTNTDRTITLPDSTGSILDSTSTLDATKLSGALPALDGSALTGMPAGGKVLQVVSATKTNTSSTGSSTFADVSGLSVTITPTSTTSKILVTGHIAVSWDSAEAKVAARITRNGTAIAIGDTNGTRLRTTGYFYLPVESYGPMPIPVNYLDSPASTSALTYKWQFNAMDNTGVVYVNRSDTWVNSTTYGTAVSTITVMEIGA